MTTFLKCRSPPCKTGQRALKSKMVSRLCSLCCLSDEHAQTKCPSTNTHLLTHPRDANIKLSIKHIHYRKLYAQPLWKLPRDTIPFILFVVRWKLPTNNEGIMALVACNAGVFLERERWIILRCCHLGRGSARGLERVKSEPKGEDDWLTSNTRAQFIIQRSPMKNACTADYGSRNKIEYLIFLQILCQIKGSFILDYNWHMLSERFYFTVTFD